MAHPKGATRCESPPQRRALTGFIGRKAQSDTIPARLSGLSDEHVNRTPEDVAWADFGTLGSYLEQLRQVSDAAFRG